MNERVENDRIEMFDRTEAPGRSIEVGHVDSPLPPSVGGAEVEVKGVPAAWARGTPGFQVRVTYRNAPANAGLLVGIGRDVPLRSLRRFVDSGGWFTERPIPIEGNGTFDIPFEGLAYSAPADGPVALDVDTGRHIIIATIVNHRGAVMGMILPAPNARTLAATRSAPIAIQGSPSQRPIWHFSDQFQRVFELRLSTAFDYTPGDPLLRSYRAGAPRFGRERICVDFDMVTPFSGRVRACAPANLRSEVGIFLPELQEISFAGTIGYQPTVVRTRPFPPTSAWWWWQSLRLGAGTSPAPTAG